MRPTLIALARSFCARIQVKTYPFNSILHRAGSSTREFTVLDGFSPVGDISSPEVLTQSEGRITTSGERIIYV